MEKSIALFAVTNLTAVGIDVFHKNENINPYMPVKSAM